MKFQTFEIEADTVDAAEKQADAKKPAARHMLFKEVLCDGKPQTVQASAEAIVDALAKAKAQMPLGAQVLNERRSVEPFEKVLEIRATSEEEALKRLRQKVDGTATIGPVSMKAAAKAGFLGIGKRRPVFQAEVKQPAVAQVEFQQRPKVRITIEELPDHGLCQVCGKTGADLREIKIEPVILEGQLFEFKTQGYFACGSECLSAVMAVDQLELEEEKKKIQSRLLVQSAFSGKRSVAVSADLDTMMTVIREGEDRRRRNERWNEEAKRMSQRHCWACGQGTSLEAEKCPACFHTLKLSW